MYRVLLIILSVLAIGLGLVVETLLPGIVGIPGWAVSIILVALLVITATGMHEAALTDKCDGLAADLEASRLDLDGVREELAAIRDQLDAIPDTGAVVAELRVLQGLMEQFPGKRGTDKSTDPAAPIDQAVDPDEQAASGTPTPEQLPTPVPQRVNPEPMLDYDDAEILHYIEKALREDRVDLYLQPTVLLPQRKRVFYECFSRITDDGGNVIRPEQYLPVAEQAGLITAVDNLLLFRCVQLVRRARRDHLDVAFFCNISDATLTDVDFFTDFIDFMAANQHLATSLVFEFAHATLRGPSYQAQTSLQRLAALGFRFSVDQIGKLDIDLPKLASQGFKYIKIDAHLLHEMVRGDAPRLNMRSLKGALDREAMDLIVEKIETEEMLLDLLDLKIDFGQGYLFGEPRPTARES